MTPALQSKVQRIAFRARRLVRLHAIGWFVATVCAIFIAFGWLDYLLRFQDEGVRWIGFATVVALMAWSFLRYVYPAWRYRCSELQAARRIERRFPSLGDRLSSAVEFSAQRDDDVQAGSTQLRRTVVAETEAVVEQLNLSDCLETRQVRRALLLGLTGCAVIVALALVDGPSVALAAKRIMRPWGNEQWPRRHVLRFVTPPQRLARGQDFEIELVDIRDELPERVEIHYWMDGDEPGEVQTFEMQPLGDKVAHRLSNVTKSFRYRATGGDDQRMEWIELQVLEPPKILEQVVQLLPPAYTGQPPHTSDGAVRALVGTRAAIHVRVDKRLSSAELQTDTMPDDTPILLKLDSDQRGFSSPENVVRSWVITQSGYYALHMVDNEGLESGGSQRWDVHAVTDDPPTVSLTLPSANLFVTPEAVTGIQVVVRDDIAIASAELRFTRSDREGSGEQAVTLLQGPNEAVGPDAALATGVQASGMEETIEYAWDLREIDGLEPGGWIDFTIVALDYQPQLGVSATRRLTLISAEQLDDRLAQRQADILTQISEVARLQTESQSQTAGLQIQLEELQRLERADVDQLQSIELNQRQVAQRLAHPVDGVLTQIDQLLSELRSNRVDNAELEVRMNRVAEVIRGLVGGPLPAVQQEIVTALKIGREHLAQQDKSSDPPATSAARKSVADSIRLARTGQGRVAEALEALLGELSEWDSYRQLAREVGRLRRQQDETWQQTEQLRLETLAQDPQSLNPAQRAQLRQLSEGQNEISRTFDRLQSRMTEMRDRLQQREPLAAATLRDTLEAAQRLAVGGSMRDASDQLNSHRLGQASDRQREIVDALQQLQDLLANRRENALDRIADQLRAAASELAKFEQRQDDIRQRLADPQNHSEAALRELAGRERELAEQVNRLGARLARLQSRQTGDLLQQAARALGDAAGNAETGNASSAQRSAQLAAEQLRRAQQQLQASLGTTEQDLLREQLNRFQQLLAGVLRGQQAVLQETQRLNLARPTPSDAVFPGWETDTLLAADDELAFQSAVSSLAKQMKGAQVLSLVLQETAASMGIAEEHLRQLRTGTETQDILQATIERLEQITAALQTARDSAEAMQQGSPPQAGNQRQNAYLIAQMKMLRAMQESLNRRTRDLDQIREQGLPWNEVQKLDQRNLALRQGQLANLLAQLLQQSAPALSTPARPNAQLDQLDRILDMDPKPGTVDRGGDE